MDDNRGEDGRVNASTLEEKLLTEDGHAFEKEGVEQLKQYLMKARESGIPIKFDGDRCGLSQVWFKGHKDLVSLVHDCFWTCVDKRMFVRRLLWLVIAHTEAAGRLSLPIHGAWAIGIGDHRSSRTITTMLTGLIIFINSSKITRTTCQAATSTRCQIAIGRPRSVPLTLTFSSTSCKLAVQIISKGQKPIEWSRDC